MLMSQNAVDEGREGMIAQDDISRRGPFSCYIPQYPHGLLEHLLVRRVKKGNEGRDGVMPQEHVGMFRVACCNIRQGPQGLYLDGRAMGELEPVKEEGDPVLVVDFVDEDFSVGGEEVPEGFSSM